MSIEDKLLLVLTFGLLVGIFVINDLSSCKKNRLHSLDGSKEIKAGRAIRMHEEILEPSNELQTFEETENKTYAVSLQDLDNTMASAWHRHGTHMAAS